MTTTIAFDPISETVTVENQELGDWAKQTYTYKEFYARCFVFEHLSYKGKFHVGILSNSQLWQAYCLCDGFGNLPVAWHDSYGWDWSHVRDSSTVTLVKVADWIADRKWQLRSIDAIIESHRQDIARIKAQGCEISLFDLLPTTF